ncbi:MAG: hypothetical protein ORN98_09025, partial [Alphaproteobacteria bacterium]|nr:hypothetical protein [Alphaproteobacteria bacterium]
AGHGLVTATKNLILSGNGDMTVYGAFDNLTGFTQGATGGFVKLSSSSGLTISSVINNGTNEVSLKAGTGHLALNGAVTGGKVTLASVGGKITQTAKLTVTGTLAADAGGGAVNIDWADATSSNAISNLGVVRGAGVSIKNAHALTLKGDVTATGVGNTITINNSFGATSADKAINLGADIVITGGDILLDLGGATNGVVHANGTGGGIFDTGEFTLHTFTGTDTSTSANLLIFADAFNFGTTTGKFYIDSGTASISTSFGSPTFRPNAQGAMVIGDDYTDRNGKFFAKSLSNALTGANVDSAKVRGIVTSDLSALSDLTFNGDIYINYSTGYKNNFTSITSTGGHVYFVGN